MYDNVGTYTIKLFFIVFTNKMVTLLYNIQCTKLDFGKYTQAL